MYTQNNLHLIDLHDELDNKLSKIEAMLFVLSSTEFDNFNNHTLQNYIDAISDVLQIVFNKQAELYEKVIKLSEAK